MQKYRLKKDLFYTKKGDIVSIPKNPPENYGLRPMYSFSENSEKGKFVGIIHKDDISKWLEEIPEKPKSVYDLRCGDIYYICTGTKYLTPSNDLRCDGFYNEKGKYGGGRKTRSKSFLFLLLARKTKTNGRTRGGLYGICL